MLIVPHAMSFFFMINEKRVFLLSRGVRSSPKQQLVRTTDTLTIVKGRPHRTIHTFIPHWCTLGEHFKGPSENKQVECVGPIYKKTPNTIKQPRSTDWNTVRSNHTGGLHGIPTRCIAPMHISEEIHTVQTSEDIKEALTSCSVFFWVHCVLLGVFSVVEHLAQALRLT